MNQVSAAGTVIAVVYMRIFLPESVAGVGIAGTGNKTEDESLLRKDSSENKPSFRDTISLLRTRCGLSFFTCQLCFLHGTKTLRAEDKHIENPKSSIFSIFVFS